MPDSPASRELADGACARLAACVDEWLDRALPEADATAVADHLARCPGCRTRVAHEVRFRDSLHRAAGPCPAPESLVERVRAALRPEPPPGSSS